MATFAVTSEPLTIHTHPNADALELAGVGLYRAVVAKGQFRTGDYALYIPEQAVVPDELLEELNLVGRLAGPAHNRVKAVRLRGELSQGIVCLPAAVAGMDLAAAHAQGVNFAELLGITKWVPEIPVHMAGEIAAAPDLLPWVDIENVKRYPTVFSPGEPVVATEKVHGSCCLFTRVSATGEQIVSSKGIGEQHCALVESEHNVYWRAARTYNLAEAAELIAKTFEADRVGIFGEVYGVGIQDLGYGHSAKHGQPAYAAFDVSVEVAGMVRWLNQDEMLEVLSTLPTPVPTVPRLYAGPYDEALLLELATGREQVSGTEANIREGIVVRPAVERHSDVLGGRAIVKVVSEKYLTRKGGTEYQ